MLGWPPICCRSFASLIGARSGSARHPESASRVEPDFPSTTTPKWQDRFAQSSAHPRATVPATPGQRSPGLRQARYRTRGRKGEHPCRAPAPTQISTPFQSAPGPISGQPGAHVYQRPLHLQPLAPIPASAPFPAPIRAPCHLSARIPGVPYPTRARKHIPRLSAHPG